MEIRLFEAGKPEGERAVDARFTIDKGSIRIGGDGSDVVVAGASGTAAEIAVAGGKATLTRPGRARVSVGGREVDRGGTVDLGIETLVAIEGTELVYKVEGGAGAPGGPESERPSYMARDVLKQVYAVLGVPEGDLPTLVVYDRDEKLVKRLDLGPDEGEVTIGRGSDNRLVLYHASVSKTHARVVRDGVGFLVYDLQSRNGVEVNEIRVQGKQRLKSGDRIRIGEFTLRFGDP
ncbi:MAG TPA: FHA domain-containing protein [Planctomycetota bacterium]|nr:FHA domain-containing protein [Planctomycetota bacterium]